MTQVSDITIYSSGITIYSSGLCYCSVCAPVEATRGTIEADVNFQNPTGLDSQWKIADEPFSCGGDNPHVCESDPNRQHWLLVC